MIKFIIKKRINSPILHKEVRYKGKIELVSTSIGTPHFRIRNVGKEHCLNISLCFDLRIIS